MEVSASHKRWRHVQRLFAEVVGLDPERRTARLERVGREDPRLREQVQALLDRHERGEPLTGSPPPSRIGSGGLGSGDSLILGEIVGPYCLLEELGRGAMGIVYRAQDTRLKRPVALKFLSPQLSADKRARARLEREAQAASALDHPNICTVYEIGETDDGRLYLALACYDGETLENRIERGPLAVDDAVRIAVRMARGLAAAHRHGIVHRDVKPSNVLVTEDEEVKILDFGIARVADSDLTGTGDTLGTAAYMSPEHLRGQPEARSDVWALGVVLYEMLTGRRPFRGDYEAALLYAVLHEAPAPLDRDDVPDALAEIVRRCLEKDPDLRYPSAEEVEVDLERLRLGEPAAHPSRRVSRRTRRLAFGLGALTLLLVLALSPLRTAAMEWLGLGAVPVEKRIAVLPFSVAGADPSASAFSDGLVEILTSTLTQLEQFEGKLWVVPTSEVQGRGITSAEEARRAFGVNLVVTGSVQRDASRVRSTLNLVDAVTLRQLRAEVNDVPVSQLDALQEQVVRDLEDMLGLELGAEPRRALTAGTTPVSEAYDYYVQGLGFLQRYESAESLDRAINLFERALGEDSNYTLAHASLGEAYWRKYELLQDERWVALAEVHSQRALDLNGQLPAVHVTLGMIYTGTGRPAEAVNSYDQALALNPADAAAYRGLAKAYEAQDRSDEAEAIYQRAIGLRPDYWGGHNDLGVFYWRYGRFEEAVGPFSRVVKLTPDNARGYSNLGAVFYNLERWDEAIAMFERSIQVEPTYNAYTNLATLYYYQARYTDAARMYEEALSINDQNYVVWGNLGSAYYWTPSERDKAEEAYRHAIKRAEEQNAALGGSAPLTDASLGGYYAQIGEHTKAVKLVEAALAAAPEDPSVAFQAGSMYEQLGERETALKWIRRALELGHPRSEVQNEPGLRDLRADPQYRSFAGEE